MNIELGLLIAFCGFVLSFIVALTTSKKNTKEDGEKEGYQLGILTQKLKDIDDKLEKIEKKLDTYENDIKRIVDDEIKKHELKYHNKGE